MEESLGKELLVRMIQTVHKDFVGLLDALPRMCCCGKEAILFKAFVMASFGAFRVNELVPQAAGDRSKCGLELTDVQFAWGAGSSLLRYSKTRPNWKGDLIGAENI